ncbi:MAG: HAD family hydrolase [Anaerolineae bacterium]|nr:HAD family hydrolase [Anaerolineae bacterium]
MFDWIGFDADDTLWENEAYYQSGRQLLRRMMQTYDPPDGSQAADAPSARVDARLDEVEIANLPCFGYGAMAYALSMIEAAIDVTSGRVSAADIGQLVQVARQIILAEVELFEHTETALRALAPHYPLLLVTKGDLQHQLSKVDRSGLRGYFRHVEVVTDKTTAIYESLLGRLGVAPQRFVMVGNSLRSDILPVLELGGWAVYVPARVGWSHEHAELPPQLRGRFCEIEHLGQLPEALQRLQQQA